MSRLEFARKLSKQLKEENISYVQPKIKKGENVVIHTGAILGSEGFGFERNEHYELEKVPRIGGVVIGNDVEIGENTCISRGTINDTIVDSGTKISSLVYIGNNAKIGKYCAVCGSVFIGGSVVVGDYTYIAPGAIIRDNIEIGFNCLIGMGSIVTKSISDNMIVYGNPAKEVRKNKPIFLNDVWN